MADRETMIQTEIVFDGASFLLSQDQDVDDLRERIESATRSSGTSVSYTHLTLPTNREV